MLANNEVGTVQPHGRPDHAACALTAEWRSTSTRSRPRRTWRSTSATSTSTCCRIAAHKFEGPKGIGALYLRHGTILLPQMHGGAQERYRRAGTENVAGAVGMAVAYELARAEQAETAPRLAALRDRLRDAILALPNVELTGHPRKRLPGHLSVIARDDGRRGARHEPGPGGRRRSTGSACTTGSTEPSHVLTALGYPEEEARGSLRI